MFYSSQTSQPKGIELSQAQRALVFAELAIERIEVTLARLVLFP